MKTFNDYSISGNFKFKSYDYEGAIEDFTKAIELNPKPTELYKLLLMRGHSKRELMPKDYQGALEDYTQAIEINSKDFEAYLISGLCKDYLKDYEGAIQDFTKAVELKPKDNKTDIEFFIEDARNKIIPKNADTYNNIGAAKYGLQDYQGAIQDYNKAIELNSNYADAYSNRGLAKCKLEDYRGAILDFNKALELNPKNANAYIVRGVAKYKLGKEAACLDWSKAGELGNSEAYDLISKYCK